MIWVYVSRVFLKYYLRLGSNRKGKVELGVVEKWIEFYLKVEMLFNFK